MSGVNIAMDKLLGPVTGLLSVSAPVMDQDVSSQELDKAVEKKESEKAMAMGKGPGPRDSGGRDRKPAEHAGPPSASRRAAAHPLNRPSASEALDLDSAETALDLDAPDRPDLDADSEELTMTQQRRAGRRAGLHTVTPGEAAGDRDRGSPEAAAAAPPSQEPAPMGRSGGEPPGLGPLRRGAVPVHSEPPVLTGDRDWDSAETRELPDTPDLDRGSREVSVAQVRKRARSLWLVATTSSAKGQTPELTSECGICMGQVTRDAPVAGESITRPPPSPSPASPPSPAADTEADSVEWTTELHPQHHKSPAGPITTTRTVPSSTTADDLETDSVESLRDNSTEGYVIASDTFAIAL